MRSRQKKGSVCGYGIGTKKNIPGVGNSSFQNSPSADALHSQLMETMKVKAACKLILTSKTHKMSCAAAARDGPVTGVKGRQKSVTAAGELFIMQR